MTQYKASRLVAGNRVFPVRIIIDDLGVTIKNPSLFSGTESTIPFSRIASVNIDCPFVGFSTIIIKTTGEGEIRAHGFLKREVVEMKGIILGKIN